MMTDKDQLINIYQDTKKKCNIIKIKNKSVLYDITRLNLDLSFIPVYTDTTVEVKNEDTLDMSLRLVNNKLNPLVLNMASDWLPGGGVKKGSMAQEECIFRRTNAFMTHYEQWYPLPKDTVIYSPEVTIIKDSNYKLLDNYNKVAMIAVPAIRNPYIVEDAFILNDYKLMFYKIESIFKIALMHNHDSLVLGALGCGAFNNPPLEVAKIFEIMLRIYKKYFKYIGFAILVVREKDNDNLQSFKNIIL